MRNTIPDKCCDIEKAKSSEIISQKKFNKHANKKSVKTRTPYKFVDEYEKQFKQDFGKMLGAMSSKFIKDMSVKLEIHKK